MHDGWIEIIFKIIGRRLKSSIAREIPQGVTYPVMQATGLDELILCVFIFKRNLFKNVFVKQIIKRRRKTYFNS